MDSSCRDPSSKRPSNLRPSGTPTKRLCKSPSSTSLSTVKLHPSIQSIIHLPEDAVWSLRKGDLRDYFLALQRYALNPYPLNAPLLSRTAPVAPSTSQVLPQFLTLPLEIRELIYSYLLPPPSNTPIRGPHPRQLQTHLHLTQPFPPALLRVSRQINNEALPIFYGATSQVVHVTIDYNVWVHKTKRSDLVLSSRLTSAIRHIHIRIHLGSEKRNNKPGEVESEARLVEVVKGVRKLTKWLAGADTQSLRISWQEPPQTYTWEQKKEILDGLRPLRPKRVDVGEINWGLNWNKGRKFRFPIEYLKELEGGQRGDGSEEDAEIFDAGIGNIT